MQVKDISPYAMDKRYAEMVVAMADAVPVTVDLAVTAAASAVAKANWAFIRARSIVGLAVPMTELAPSTFATAISAYQRFGTVKVDAR